MPSPPSPWSALRLIAPIKDVIPQITDEEIQLALAPDYPAEVHELHLEARYGDWEQAAGELAEKITAARAGQQPVGVFGFAPVPLLAMLGRLLGDKDERVQLFQAQRHRGAMRWRWDADTGDAFSLTRTTHIDDPGADHVAVMISISGKVDRGLVADAMGGRRYALHELSIPAPGRNSLSRREQLRAFVRSYEDLLDACVRPGNQLHLFAAVPIPIAVELGRRPHPGALAGVHVYEWADGRYAHALDLFAARQSPQARQQGQRVVVVMADVTDVVGAPLRMSKTPITQDQYRQLMGGNPARFHDRVDSAARPVEQVTWHEAAAFCNRLSQQDGLPPAYRIADGEAAAVPGAAGYRLPTLAEWRACCEEDEAAHWVARTETRAVGQGAASAHGLLDMLGLVWEWRQDAVDATRRVVSGGGYDAGGWAAHCSVATFAEADARSPARGFRVVCVPS